MKSNQYLKKNVKVHNKTYQRYDQKHTEIFNPIEQDRIHNVITKIVRLVKTNSSPKVALDYGCGSGNLTKHLLEAGLNVVAADVSDNFLKMILQKYGSTNRVCTLKINGINIENIPGGSYDIVSTYSVLHHVYDYMKIIKEMIRVTKPGGIVYLDHEFNDNYWYRKDKYLELYNQGTIPKSWRRYFNPLKYLSKIKYIIFKYLRYHEDGDIHIWIDDHIDWDAIEENIKNNKCEILLRDDYLLYDDRYPMKTYNKYKSVCNDMTMIIARKND